MSTRIVIVTGSRAPIIGFTASDVEAVLTRFAANPGMDELFHGACDGVDEIADEWAKSSGVLITPFPVPDEEWRRLRKAAGPIRNARMCEAAARRFDAGAAVTLIAFPGNSGTHNCTQQARLRGLAIERWEFTPRGAVCHAEACTRTRPTEDTTHAR